MTSAVWVSGYCDDCGASGWVVPAERDYFDDEVVRWRCGEGCDPDGAWFWEGDDE